MPEETYEMPWTRRYRGLLVFLLDQSASMSDELKIGNKIYTNGQMATATLNELLYTIINKTAPDPDTGHPKDYCDILVLGYGDQIVPLVDNGQGRPISMSDLATHTKGQHMVQAERFDRSVNQIVQVKEMRPYWVVDNSNGRSTEMAQALQTAYQGIQNWLAADARRRESFPPIVINITDGAHNGTGNPVDEATKIHSLYTRDGYVLLFNCHLTSLAQQQPVVFPSTEQEVAMKVTEPKEYRWARQLFQMSSVIPRTMVQNAQATNVGLKYGARGFLYHASPSDLMNFLDWGTRPLEK